jgi:hypothetical protein
METGEDVRGLLTEIRDLEREHLKEYKRVSEEILSLQKSAVSRQELFGRVYRRMVLFGGVLMVALLVLLVYLLAKWWGPLFGR